MSADWVVSGEQGSIYGVLTAPTLVPMQQRWVDLAKRSMQITTPAAEHNPDEQGLATVLYLAARVRPNERRLGMQAGVDWPPALTDQRREDPKRQSLRGGLPPKCPPMS